MNTADEQAVRPLKSKDGDPVFGELWQAQVLAIADTLVAQGKFSTSEWSNALGLELECAETSGEADDQDTYYRAALRALETLLARHNGVSSEELTKRRNAWAQAYQATPHGQPVELANANG